MLNREEELRFCKARRAAIALDYQNLNPEQRRAALATDGPLLLLAGAGSGKTTVLIHRIANLMKYGRGSDCDEAPAWAAPADLAFLEGYVQNPDPAQKAEQERLCRVDPAVPWSIIAITFTNKAAGELKERLERMLGPSANDIWASTFHSACVRILRRDIDRLGFTSSFTIYDTADSERVIKDIVKDFNLDEKAFAPRSILGYISRAKDAMKLGKDYLQECEKAGDYRLVKIAKVYAEYERRLREANALDFDDIILDTVRLLQNFDDVREYYQKKFRYVLIDEYQDTNNLQYLLASTLAGGYENICVVGDDDQSIYRFRGATIENILSFESQYKGARVIRLEQNYRSTKNILEASNAVIRNNEGRKGKELWTEHEAGDKVHCYTAMNEHDEAQFVAAQILAGFSGGRSWREHAVLYRMNAQSNQLEQAFKRNGIPYRIIGGIRFFDRAEVKDMMAYLCAVNNPNDDLRLSRIINNPPRGIGATTVERAQAIAQAEGCSLWDVVSHARNFPELQKAAPRLSQFAELMAELRKLSGEMELPDFYEELVQRTGYAVMLEQKNTVEDRTRLENVHEVLSSIQNYLENAVDEPSLAGFLDEIALYTDLDSHDPSEDCVVMMTMHSAKGLEFPVVFVVGVEEGIFPGHPRHRRGRGDGGGAPPVLRGHDPGQGEALYDLRLPAHALRPHQLQPALPLFGESRRSMWRSRAACPTPSGPSGRPSAPPAARRCAAPSTGASPWAPPPPRPLPARPPPTGRAPRRGGPPPVGPCPASRWGTASSTRPSAGASSPKSPPWGATPWWRSPSTAWAPRS